MSAAAVRGLPVSLALHVLLLGAVASVVPAPPLPALLVDLTVDRSAPAPPARPVSPRRVVPRAADASVTVRPLAPPASPSPPAPSTAPAPAPRPAPSLSTAPAPAPRPAPAPPAVPGAPGVPVLAPPVESVPRALVVPASSISPVPAPPMDTAAPRSPGPLAVASVRPHGAGDAPDTPSAPGRVAATGARPEPAGGAGGEAGGSASPPGEAAAPAEGALGGADSLALAVAPGGAGEYDAYLALLRRRVQQVLAYPAPARRRGVSGTVQLDIVLDLGGKVGDVMVVQSSSHTLLDEAAVEAVRALERVPFPAGLRPRPLRVRLPVVFELR